MATLAVLGGSAAVVARILGPTADYFGAGLKSWAEARVANLLSVFSNAEGKLGAELDTPGEVSPRVLKEILSEGSFSSDPVGIEYFGGILASSRTPDGKDDRGASWGRLVANLSTYALKAHFVIYSSLVRQFAGTQLSKNSQLGDLRIRIDQEEFITAIGVIPGDMDMVESVGAHVFFSLHQYDLVGATAWGEKTPNSDALCITATASASGAELFLWALGLGQEKFFPMLFETGDHLPTVDGIPTVESVSKIEGAAL